MPLAQSTSGVPAAGPAPAPATPRGSPAPARDEEDASGAGERRQRRRRHGRACERHARQEARVLARRAPSLRRVVGVAHPERSTSLPAARRHWRARCPRRRLPTTPIGLADHAVGSSLVAGWHRGGQRARAGAEMIVDRARGAAARARPRRSWRRCRRTAPAAARRAAGRPPPRGAAGARGWPGWRRRRRPPPGRSDGPRLAEGAQAPRGSGRRPCRRPRPGSRRRDRRRRCAVSGAIRSASRRTAVLRPEREKSAPARPCIGRGKAKRSGSPARPRVSTCGPPG